MSDDVKLGKLPAKASVKSLHFADFVDPQADAVPPKETKFWRNRAKFSLRSFGNTTASNCTRASQANLARRMERIEQRKTIDFTDEEVLRVYYDMTKRRYGGGDTGAYEEDALSDWRNSDYTFRDNSGHPHTIDAFTRINVKNIEELKRAIWMAGSHGIKICFNLPLAWQHVRPPEIWDIPRNPDGSPAPLIGDWIPGSWGGHSLTSDEYGITTHIASDLTAFELVHSWDIPNQLVTADAVAAYSDEAHLVIDSVDAWRKKHAGLFLADKLVSMVNEVSSVKIK
jgi:hypothetical protein